MNHYFLAFITTIALGPMNTKAATEIETPLYGVQKQISLPGNERWDYLTLDSETRRLYLTRATHVDVYNLDTLEATGKILGTDGVHGVAIAHPLGQGFVSCGKSNSVLVFDLKTNQKITDIKVESKPDAIVFEAKTSTVFAFNGGSNSVSVIDGQTHKVLKTISLLGTPEFAVSNDSGTVYVNIEDKNLIQVIDAGTKEIKANYPLTLCKAPGGLAIDLKHKLLFASCDNRMLTVINAESGKEIASAPIGDGPDAVSFDPKKNLIFTTNGASGTLSVIETKDEVHFKTHQELKTVKSARTVALDDQTHRLFSISAEFGPKPKATAENPKARPELKPGSVSLLVISPKP